MSPGEPWYVEAFQRDYLEVYPHRNLCAARREVAGLMSAGLEGRTLDLCCGVGRHSLAMLEAGLEVIGIDLSAELLDNGIRNSGAQRLIGRLLRADARALPLGASRFDSVACLFSSFGYLDEGGDRTVAEEIARVLRPGGVLILDLMNAGRVREQLVPTSTTERAGLVLHERRWLSEGGQRVEKDVLLRFPGRAPRSWRESVRLYEPLEVATLLQATGVKVSRIAGGFDNEPFGPGAERMVVWARKPG